MNSNSISNPGTYVADFSLPLDNKVKRNNKDKVNVEVIFTRKIETEQITHKAVVLNGTFSLKERINTLKNYEEKLAKASSTPQRVKRAIITLVTVGIIAAGIAAMVFGGSVGLVVGGVGLGIFMLASDMIISQLVLGHPLEYNMFFPITMPIFFTYYMLTYESKRAKKVENTQSEINKIALYVTNKHEAINNWLQERHKEFSDLIEKEKVKLNPSVTVQELKSITAELGTLDYKLNRVSDFIEKLNASHELAKGLLQSKTSNSKYFGTYKNIEKEVAVNNLSTALFFLKCIGNGANKVDTDKASKSILTKVFVD
jgi:hypothetical protein